MQRSLVLSCLRCLFLFFVKLFHQDQNKLKLFGDLIVSILNWYDNIHSETKIIICTRKAWQQHDIILDPSKLLDRLIMLTAWAARTLILQQLSADVHMKIYRMYSLPANVNPEITSSIQPKLLSSSHFQTEMMSSKEMRCPCKVCKEGGDIPLQQELGWLLGDKVKSKHSRHCLTTWAWSLWSWWRLCYMCSTHFKKSSPSNTRL